MTDRHVNDLAIGVDRAEYDSEIFLLNAFFFKERGYEFGTLTSTGYICHHNTANIRKLILKKRAEKAAKTAKAEKQKSQAAQTGDSLKLSN